MMDNENKIQNCIKLISKLPCSKLDENITAISNLIYEEDDLLNEFLQKVDNRIEISNEDGQFIKCEYNRDGDSYRAPGSNKYFPPLDSESEARYPTKEIRQLEIKLNKMFNTYAHVYYSSTSIASVYCWELGQNLNQGFAVSVLIRNAISIEKEVDSGVWESNNVVNVTYTNEGDKLNVLYKLTTTIVLQMNFHHNLCGKITLSGTVSKQVQESHMTKVFINDDFHVQNIGLMVEECESSLRNEVEEIYVRKSKEIIDTARFSPVMGKPNMDQAKKLKDVFGDHK